MADFRPPVRGCRFLRLETRTHHGGDAGDELSSFLDARSADLSAHGMAPHAARAGGPAVRQRAGRRHAGAAATIGAAARPTVGTARVDPRRYACSFDERRRK